jgi:hypothetical protein
MRADLQNAKKTSESGNITKPGYSVTHGIKINYNTILLVRDYYLKRLFRNKSLKYKI